MPAVRSNVLSLLTAITLSQLAPVAIVKAAPTSYARAESIDVYAYRENGEAKPLPSDISPNVWTFGFTDASGKIIIKDISPLRGGLKELPNPLSAPPALFGFMPDGQTFRLATNPPGGGGQIVEVDIATGATVMKIELPAQTKITAMISSIATGNIAVISAGPTRKLHLFDGKTGAEIFSAETKTATNVTFSPDGQRIITSGSDRSVRIGVIEFWNARTGEREHLITRPAILGATPAGVIAISPDGRTIAVQNLLPAGVFIADPSLEGATATVIRIEDRTELFKLSGHTGELVTISFSEDGSRILTGSRDMSARIWDAKTGSLITTLTGHKPAGQQIAPSDFVSARFASPSRFPKWNHGADAVVTKGSDDKFIWWEDAAYKQQKSEEVFARKLAEAEQGETSAMVNVGRALVEGNGTSKDVVKADYWFNRAAEAGYDTAQMVMARNLIRAEGARQDCRVASEWIRKAQPPTRPADPIAALTWSSLEISKNEALQPIGGVQGAANMSPTIQADLLESQMLDALTRQEHKAFLANLCAFEFLGHIDRLPAPDRNELSYYRAVALEAQGKPVAALTSLNDYLNSAGRSGANYQQAITMLRPLQQKASQQ